jgi:hypothetical protein
MKMCFSADRQPAQRSLAIGASSLNSSLTWMSASTTDCCQLDVEHAEQFLNSETSLRAAKEYPMEILHAYCAGIDVHKKVVVVTVRVPDATRRLHKETRSFDTMTASLLVLSDWLTGHGVTHVAIASTGEYWNPIYNLLSGRTTKGNQALAKALTQAAWAASHTKHTYLSTQYRRLAARRGRKRALVAVEHSILVIAYHLIQRQEPYRELGGDYFDRRRPEATARRLVKRLEKLGYQVLLQQPPLIAAA